jgi:hypothetical protein
VISSAYPENNVKSDSLENRDKALGIRECLLDRAETMSRRVPHFHEV